MARKKTLKEASEPGEPGEPSDERLVVKGCFATLPIPFGVQQYCDGMAEVQRIRGEIEDLENDRKKTLAQYKERIEDKELARDQLLDELGQGCTYTEVECQDEWDFLAKTVTRIRFDTGAVVSTREMTERELQMEIAGLEATELMDRLMSPQPCAECGVLETADEFAGWHDDERKLCTTCHAKLYPASQDWRNKPEHSGVCRRCDCDGSLEKFRGWANRKKTLCVACAEEIEKQGEAKPDPKPKAQKATPPCCSKCGASTKEVLSKPGGWATFDPPTCFECAGEYGPDVDAKD